MHISRYEMKKNLFIHFFITLTVIMVMINFSFSFSHTPLMYFSTTTYAGGYDDVGMMFSG